MRATTFVVRLAVLALAACSDGGTEPAAPQIIILTQAQASAVMGRINAIAPLHSEIRWLADSASLAIKAGAEVDPLSITTDLGAGPFYAVGLQHAVTVVSSSSTSTNNTLYFIAFNDPSNPTDFIVISGTKDGSGTTVPTEASAAFGGNSVVGHMFHMEGSTIAAYRATTGSASLTSGSPETACAALPLPSNVSCFQTTLQATFSIIQAARDNGGVLSASKSASLSQTTVAGIRFATTRQL